MPAVRAIFLLLALVAAVSAQTPPRPAHPPPQAKTQQEYKDYNSAYAITGGAAMEKAADEFAAKYPASELRPYLYSKAMHEYQTENNPAKMLTTGENVLKLDPDNSIALVLTATVLADAFNTTDADFQQKAGEIKRRAERALATVDSGFAPPANATPEQIAAYKSTLQSMSHSALGIMELKIADDAAAETDLKAAAEFDQRAVDLDKNPDPDSRRKPDPYIWYHLALAQDHQKKYAAALGSVNEALKYTDSNPDLGRLAQGEHDRLVKLTSEGAPAPAPTPPPK